MPYQLGYILEVTVVRRHGVQSGTVKIYDGVTLLIDSLKVNCVIQFRHMAYKAATPGLEPGKSKYPSYRNHSVWVTGWIRTTAHVRRIYPWDTALTC